VNLEPDTAVNVTLYGNHTESETPYTAKLVSFYEKEAPTERVITGIRREVQMLDVLPEFGDVYFLSNSSLVSHFTKAQFNIEIWWGL